MDPFLILHISAGTLGLLTGYVALYSAKGATVHRKSGILFVYVMLAMSVSGMLMALIRNAAPAVNVPAALLTAYLVMTSFTTVKPSLEGSRPLLIGGMTLILAVTLVNINFGREAIANGGSRKGIPAFPFLMFAVVGVLSFAGDLRVLRAGPLRGAFRVARHLWRMCYALFIAAMSFFIGQMDVIPKPIRILPLLAVPIVAVLVTMIYWMWRVRFRKSLRKVTMRALEGAGHTAL